MLVDIFARLCMRLTTYAYGRTTGGFRVRQLITRLTAKYLMGYAVSLEACSSNLPQVLASSQLAYMLPTQVKAAGSPPPRQS